MALTCLTRLFSSFIFLLLLCFSWISLHQEERDAATSLSWNLNSSVGLHFLCSCCPADLSLENVIRTQTFLCVRACVCGDPEGIPLTRLYVERLICALFMDAADESGRFGVRARPRLCRWQGGGTSTYSLWPRHCHASLSHTHSHAAPTAFSGQRYLVL